MFLSPDIVVGIVRSHAPEVINYAAPYLSGSVLPLLYFLSTIIGGLTTISASLDKLVDDYENFTTNPNEHSFVQMKHFSREMREANLQSIGLMFDEFGLGTGECPLAISCVIGKITARESPILHFLTTKLFKDHNMTYLGDYLPHGDRNGSLKTLENVFISSMVNRDNHFCKKQNYDCQFIQSFERFVAKLQQKIQSTTTTTTTPNPLESRGAHMKPLLVFLTNVFNKF